MFKPLDEFVVQYLIDGKTETNIILAKDLLHAWRIATSQANKDLGKRAVAVQPKPLRPR